MKKKFLAAKYFQKMWRMAFNRSTPLIYIILALKAGVSNSNWSEGHILEIKCSAGRSL
jgi:hypothetical protein